MNRSLPADPGDVGAHPEIARARALLHSHDAATVEEQVRIATIPAPTGEEGERAAYVAGRFRELGLMDVHTDEAGNVLARLAGGVASAPAEEAVIAAAHLDTVFPAGTVLCPQRSGSRIHAPGIADNARGLAAILAIARVLGEVRARTVRPVWFVATVGEEGAGDLRGVKHLFRAGSAFIGASAFVSLDGSGIRPVVHRAVGSRRLRVRVRGPGGHSWSDFGVPNPIHALGAAIARIREIRLSSSPPAALTVARTGGGTSVNAIPAEAWLELDLRSESTDVLSRTEAAVRRALARGLEDEDQSQGSTSPVLSLEVEVIGDRPSGTVPAHHPLVRAAMGATRMIGCQPELIASSTDANVPISLGLPAVTIGAGGESGGIHTLEEWYDNRDGARGIERALLLIVAAAGMAG